MAIVTGAIIAGGVAVADTIASRKAAKRAGRAQVEGAEASLAESRRQFDLTREDLGGFRERGDVAGERLSEFLGLRGVEAEQGAIAGFQESPGQKFLRERSERALLRNQAAVGGLGGGNVLTALQEQAIGIASGQLGERKDRLAQLSGSGLSAASTGAVVGADISRTIAGGERGLGDVRATDILRREETRRSGLARLAQSLTGSGNFFDAIRNRGAGTTGTTGTTVGAGRA